MEKLAYADKLGKGTWVNSNYFLHLCPLCGEEMSFRFMGSTGIWSCWACNKTGDNLDDLKTSILNSTYGRINHGEVDFEKVSAPDGLVLVSEYKKPPTKQHIPTGFRPLDKMTGGLQPGELTIITGKTGEGKSTFSGQLALNIIDSGHKVCFYSGELTAGRFQDWIFSQAAGTNFLNSYEDEFGATRYSVDPFAEVRIRKWLGDRLVLYDNTVVKSSERNAILERFSMAHQHYQSDVFFIDNLMTADFETENAQNYWIAQGNFIRQICEFALQHHAHVFLIAHPKKGDFGSFDNDRVAGSGDTTKLASNVIGIKRLKDDEVAKFGCNSMLTLSKQRGYGDDGDIRLNFDSASRRFTSVGSQNIEKYGWEDLC